MIKLTDKKITQIVDTAIGALFVSLIVLLWPLFAKPLEQGAASNFLVGAATLLAALLAVKYAVKAYNEARKQNDLLYRKTSLEKNMEALSIMETLKDNLFNIKELLREIDAPSDTCLEQPNHLERFRYLPITQEVINQIEPIIDDIKSTLDQLSTKELGFFVTRIRKLPKIKEVFRDIWGYKYRVLKMHGPSRVFGSNKDIEPYYKSFMMYFLVNKDTKYGTTPYNFLNKLLTKALLEAYKQCNYYHSEIEKDINHLAPYQKSKVEAQFQQYGLTNDGLLQHFEAHLSSLYTRK